MSIRSVKAEIKQAIAGGTPFKPEPITQPEARKIVAEAQKGSLTNGEVKAIVDAVETPRGMHTMAVGEGPSFNLTPAAEKVFEKFFETFNIPGGAHREAIRETCAAFVADLRGGAGLGKELTKKPDTKGLVSVVDYNGRAGSKLDTFYFDVKKQQFFVSEQNASARTSEKFYGPFSMLRPESAGNLDAVKLLAEGNARSLLENDCNISLSRSHSQPTVTSIKPNAQGNFDIVILVHAWNDPNKMRAEYPVEIDRNGHFVAAG